MLGRLHRTGNQADRQNTDGDGGFFSLRDCSLTAISADRGRPLLRQSRRSPWCRGSPGQAAWRRRHGENEVAPARAKRNKPIIGLAGGIGAGKTAVAQILETLGAAVIDFDRLAHAELNAAEVAGKLRRWWGGGVFSPDGTIDREAVAAIAFSDPGELARLERLIHPRLNRPREELVAGYLAEEGVKAIVFDAPKLFEAQLNQTCDTVIYIEADRSVRLRRVARSRGWTEEEFARRENLQNPLDMKKANADHVVINQSGIGELRSQVERVFSSVLASFA